MNAQEPRRPLVTGRRALVTAGLASSLAVATGSRASAVGRTGSPVSVLDLGAVGDGVTDDTVAVRSAVAQAVAEGRSLLVPAGTYLVDAPIVIRDAPSFVIDMQGTLKRKDQSTADAVI